MSQTNVAVLEKINFRHNHPDAITELALSYLAENLGGVAFYDSIIVFEKQLKKYLNPNSDELRALS